MTGVEVPPPPPGPTGDAAAATTGASVMRGGLWNALSRFIPQGYTLVLSIAAARFLGPERMGQQSFIAFVALSATALASTGLSQSVQRFVADTLGSGDRARVRGFAAWALRAQAVPAVVAGLAIGAVGLSGGEPAAAWLVAGAITLITALHTLPSAVLAGAQRWREASTAGLITGALAVPAVIAVLALGGGITGMFAAEAVAATVGLLWTAWLARRLLKGLAPTTTAAGPLARRAILFAVQTTLASVITLIVFTRSEFFFLKHYSTDPEVALYSIAFAAQAGLALVPAALAGTTLPAFATLLGAGSGGRARSGYARASRLMVLLSLPMTALALALGPAAIEATYGRSYEGAGPVALIMLLVLPLWPVMSLSNAVLIALGRIRVTLTVGAFAAVLNLSLDAALIPRLDAIGAAIANTAAQWVAIGGTLLVARRAIGPAGWPPRALAGLLGASAGGGAVAFGAVGLIGGAAGVVVGGVAGILGTVALARLLGAVPAGDAAWLEEAAGGRGARAMRWILGSGPGGRSSDPSGIDPLA